MIIERFPSYILVKVYASFNHISLSVVYIVKAH